MSEEVSFEQLSISSDDSWALLDVDEPADESALGTDNVDLYVIDPPEKDLCSICNQPLSAVRFPCPSCNICLICVDCRETYDPKRISVCCHTLPPTTEAPTFYFDDSVGEDVLIMYSKDRSPFKEVHPVSCASEPNQLISSTELIQSSPATPDPNSLDSHPQTDSDNFIHRRNSGHRSLTDHVREALKLHATDADVMGAPVVTPAPETPREVHNMALGTLHSMDSDQIKSILSPKLWSQSSDSNLSSASGIPVRRMSPVLRPTVQVVRGTCSSSECQTSSSSSCSRSPPSLSSSPMTMASKILKSVAIHSASAMNHFDCMPMEALDVSPVSIKRTESKSSPERPQPGTPPGMDDRLAVDFVTRFVWDHEKLHSLIKPRPIPKSVIEQSSYNLR